MLLNSLVVTYSNPSMEYINLLHPSSLADTLIVAVLLSLYEMSTLLIVGGVLSILSIIISL